ncbi:patatin-like phospholipase family protein [Zwartia vadi]|uniref:patatin-like phospholipase family protein n=1 Tax=Zwartia vadi TaxID=3058168 RepID=UPI0025B5D096|nr:patatin-like phospholipase family protein [Zwartia vadi]MDN3987714.1 patatin-like phospholipase family protein [Zwartia vadi]
MNHRRIKLPDYPRVALVLQGGGALGSYQAGVYEGLARAGIHPNWVAGISIGALNCAIIAGNPPEKRVEMLKGFWNAICSPPSLPNTLIPDTANMFDQLLPPWGDMLKGIEHTVRGSMAAMSALIKGQDNFFTPRMLAPGGGTPDTTSFYDTAPVLATLERFADFDRINSGETRVSLGATNVATGNFVYFDSENIKLTPKHFLASGSLPPGFPATEIDGEYYWDGGCVSNTPLDYVLGVTPRKDTLVFQVDLWSARGPLPVDIFQVNERLKDIQFSSRTRSVTNMIDMAQKMRRIWFDTVARIPEKVRANDPWFDEMMRHMMGARYNVIHLIYQNKHSEGHYKDYEFSAETKDQHWQSGLHDMHETLEHPECLAMPNEGENFVTFDVHTRQRSSSGQLDHPVIKPSGNRKRPRQAPK